MATMRFNDSSNGNHNSNNNNDKRTHDFIRVLILLVLCLHNSAYSLLRRYSLGILHEVYNKYQVCLIGELLKLAFSAGMMGLQYSTEWNHKKRTMSTSSSSSSRQNRQPISSDDMEIEIQRWRHRVCYVVCSSRPMLFLASIYGVCAILSFVSLRFMGAGMYTIYAQCKVLSTALFSVCMLQRRYSATQWRALVGLVFGVLLYSEPLWGNAGATKESETAGIIILTSDGVEEASGDMLVEEAIDASLLAMHSHVEFAWGTIMVIVEVVLSGFAGIYFEKHLKQQQQQQQCESSSPIQSLSLWERNFQLALGTSGVYVLFLLVDRSGTASAMSPDAAPWSIWTWTICFLYAAGGILVALSIQYGDAVLKTLATTGAIVVSNVLDHFLLDGPLTPIMSVAAVQTILAIANYTLDATPKPCTGAAAASASEQGSKCSPPQSPTYIAQNKNINQNYHQLHSALLLSKRWPTTSRHSDDTADESDDSYATLTEEDDQGDDQHHTDVEIGRYLLSTDEEDSQGTPTTSMSASSSVCSNTQS